MPGPCTVVTVFLRCVRDLDSVGTLDEAFRTSAAHLKEHHQCTRATDTLFNPYALSCGHLFCKGCACGAASVYIFQGIRSALPEANCPTCRTAGVFAHDVHMTEIDLLNKTRSKDYWRQRLREERTEMVKHSEGYWESQAMLSMGI